MGNADRLGGAANPIGGMPGTDGGLNPLGHLGMGFGGGNLLTGSSFVMNHETRRGGILSFWSRGTHRKIYDRENALPGRPPFKSALVYQLEQSEQMFLAVAAHPI